MLVWGLLLSAKHLILAAMQTRTRGEPLPGSQNGLQFAHAKGSRPAKCEEKAPDRPRHQGLPRPCVVTQEVDLLGRTHLNMSLLGARFQVVSRSSATIARCVVVCCLACCLLGQHVTLDLKFA